MEWISPQDPEDMWAWLECDGRAFSATEYPELARLYPGRVPDLRDQFLRGGTPAQVGQTAQDSVRSHYHSQPPHTHSVGTQLTSTAVSGSAAAQTFQDRHTAGGQWGPSGGAPWPGSGASRYVVDTILSISGENVSGNLDVFYAYMTGDYTVHETNGPSSVTAHVNNGSATGTAYAGGGDNTYANSNSDGTTGGAETAPQHIRVRYLIRARP